MSRFAGAPPDLAKKLEREVPQRPVVVDFTLTANAASSTLSNAAIRPTSSFSPVARTANAAGAVAGLYHDTPTLGQVVWNHANNAQADKTFRITIHNP